MKIDNLLNEYRKLSKYKNADQYDLRITDMLEILEKSIMTSYPGIKQDYDFMNTVISNAYKVGFVRGTHYIKTGKGK